MEHTKNLNIYIYNGDVLDQSNGPFDANKGKISEHDAVFTESKELALKNPHIKKCMEAKTNILLPKQFIYSIIFVINGEARIAKIENYHSMGKDYTITYQLSENFIFYIYRSNEDDYTLTTIHLLENDD